MLRAEMGLSFEVGWAQFFPMPICVASPKTLATPLPPMKLLLLFKALRSICFVMTMFDSIQTQYDCSSKRHFDRTPESSDPKSLSGATHDGCSRLVWALIGLATPLPMSNEAISTKSNTTQYAMCFSFLEQ
jgi:hypothetical protein